MTESTAAHEEMVRSTVSQFHPNFSAGRMDLNGPLAHEGIKVTSNTVRLQGREDFVERLRRYETPFPGLQLADRVILVDGGSAAVLYALQGRHTGPYGAHEGTGRLIEAWSAEFFDIDRDGLLTDLLTVTRLDHVMAQVRGEREVLEHGRIELVPVAAVEEGTAARIRRSIHELYAPDADSRGRAAELILPEALVMVDADPERGEGPWTEHWRRLIVAFPDLSLTVDRTVLDGDRAAVGYTLSGTQDGPLDVGGEEIAPAQRSMRIQVIDMLAFDDAGRVTEIISVHNTEEIRAQLTGT